MASCKELSAERNTSSQTVYSCALIFAKGFHLRSFPRFSFASQSAPSIFSERLPHGTGKSAAPSHHHRSEALVLSEKFPTYRHGYRADGFSHSGSAASTHAVIASPDAWLRSVFLSHIFLLLQFFQLFIRQSHHPRFTQTTS